MNDTEFQRNPSQTPLQRAWPLPEIPAPRWDVVLPFAAPGADSQRGNKQQEGNIRREFGVVRGPVKRIVVLKLDHFGDFIIGLPALRSLRTAFPDATIRLICGRWNEKSALGSGLVDEVRCFNQFPERPVHGAPMESEPLSTFDLAAEGQYDIAIDLRVDEDTRYLLGRINARLRCGIGSVFQFPLLDIALPHEHVVRANVGVAVERFLFLPPDRFNSALPVKEPLHHYGPLVTGHIIGGPYTELPTGRLLAEIGFTVRGHIPGLRAAAVQFDVVKDGGQVVATRVVGRRGFYDLRHSSVSFEFDNPVQESRFQFRVHVLGRPRPGTIQFSGVTVHQLRSAAVARFRPAELHVGEKLSLLVSLVRDRTADLYGPMNNAAARHKAVPEPGGRLRIAVAPFSNSAIRNWPVEYYDSLISLLLERFPCDVLLLGTSGQVADALSIVEKVQSPHLLNMVGRTSWAELQEELVNADLVICNNSGIAHQAAALGARVLAIYSGSHQPREWGPRGMRSQALMYLLPCSPCGFETLAECPADHACMRLITPEYVLSQVEAALSEASVEAE